MLVSSAELDIPTLEVARVPQHGDSQRQSDRPPSGARALSNLCESVPLDKATPHETHMQ